MPAGADSRRDGEHPQRRVFGSALFFTKCWWARGRWRSPSDGGRGWRAYCAAAGQRAPAQAVSDAAAALRSATRERLRRQLEGDLSTILLKMLDSEPARRTAACARCGKIWNASARGVRSTRGPRSAWHAARKFAARNRLAVLVTGLSVIALVSLTIVSVYESAEARAQVARSQRVSEFAKNTFLSASSFWYSPMRRKTRCHSVHRHSGQRRRPLAGNWATIPRGSRSARHAGLHLRHARGNGERGSATAPWAEDTRADFPAARRGLRAICICTYAIPSPIRAATPTRWLPAASAWRFGASPTATYWALRLHDTAFMAVNAGEALPEAERLYREAISFSPAREPFTGAACGHDEGPDWNAAVSARAIWTVVSAC